MKTFMIFIVLINLTACSTVKEAHTEFRKEIDGFRSEWARVILKKEVNEH
jgi:hypothetical protein